MKKFKTLDAVMNEVQRPIFADATDFVLNPDGADVIIVPITGDGSVKVSWVDFFAELQRRAPTLSRFILRVT
jgi:hypothetical protein